ncbi:sacsin-like isoform X1 [Apostichopus japonicus]|uniref:sacsin-like isoform X1 n=1 Tax=Stichopus japonicus TaxID=307972 RepID=UPI003AB249FC
MAFMAAEGELGTEPNFGIRTPPLLEYLQGILRRYSDGQVLKELLQNAEDAGATEVKFLYDENQYGEDRLLNPRLKDFQGPALCSWNNAVFTEQDWKGIQTPSQSGKKNDVLKVGRFGIGFSSVYHLTDLPCIVSQRYIAMIDPCEKYLKDVEGQRSSGSKWNLGDILHKTKYEDQLLPIRKALPTETGFEHEESLDGTLFRFPLRKLASKLCSSVYTQEKTFELLDAFKEDAKIVLLFLRNIECIQLCHQLDNSRDSKYYLKVSFDFNQLDTLRSTRETFCCSLKKLKDTSDEPVDDIVLSTNFDIITENEDTSINEKWVVHQEIVFNCSDQMKKLFQKLQFLPWIGVAIPMFQQDVSIGRTFCFLPLPPGEESKSGLPVHVHGFFGVSDDRRSLKWPGGDQIQNEEAEWNKFLVDELLPQAYCKALVEATKVSVINSIHPDVVYAAFPDTRKDLGHWKTAVERLYRDLVHHPVVYCHSKDAWMELNEVVILPESFRKTPDIKEAVMKCLQLREHSVIETLPDHVRCALIKYWPEAEVVSVDFVLNCTRLIALEEVSREKRLHLLRYLLENGCVAKHLNGLALIPTDDGEFAQFVENPTKSDIIFMGTTTCPQELLPNMQGSFLRKCENADPAGLCDWYHTMLSSDSWKQFRYLSADDITSLLQTALPKWWSDDAYEVGDWSPAAECEPNVGWLQLVWQFISTEQIDLLQMQGLKLFPVTDMTIQPIKMMSVMEKSKIMQEPTDDQETQSFSEMRHILVTLGVTVCNLPEFVLKYHQVWRKCFVHNFNPSGVLGILHLVGARLIDEICKSDRETQKLFVSKLLPYFAGITLSTADKMFLKQLRLFQNSEGNGYEGKVISLDESDLIILTDTKSRMPNIRLCSVWIELPNNDVHYIVQKLGFETMSFEDLLKLTLSNAKEGEYYRHELDVLFEWIKTNFYQIKNVDQVCQLLESIKFVPNINNVLKKPNELFDSYDELIKLLVIEKDLLPKDTFLRSWRDILRELGLKNQKDIQIDQVRKAAQSILNQKNQKRADALRDYLCRFPECLSNDNSLCNFIRSVPFLDCIKYPPASYPSSIPFFDANTSLLKPSDVCIYSEDTCHLVGAVVPLVNSISEERVIEFLGIQVVPNISDVLTQLEKCVAGPVSKNLESTLHHIYGFLNDYVPTNRDIIQKLPEKWIFIDDQFVETKSVYREAGIGGLDLRPFLCVIPREMIKYDSLLSAAGIPQKVDTDVNLLLRVLQELKDPICNYNIEPVRQLSLSMDILRRLFEHPDNILVDEEIQQQLLIPSRCDPIKLLPPDEICYCDIDWMRYGLNPEDLQVEDDEDPIYIVNDIVSSTMAESLGAVPLSKRLSGADEIGGIKQTGQYEALTVRLKNILRNGYQPEAIPKEMIQNAEDAGASEVKFLLDLRTNETKMQRLLDPAMEAVQGPALWVYNDAVFTDEDLINITKLGGATKSEDGSKIGQFGLGFNAVYHITDVPSFVTNDVITIFDPHKRYLKRQIRGEGSGIQLNFLSSPLRLRRFRDQFLPYDGIFGCKILGGGTETPERFNGTLFRLPLRNESSARISDICPQSYNEANMKPLIRSLCESAAKMLLFTEKVSSISVYLWEDKASDTNLLYSANRTTVTDTNSFKDVVHRSVMHNTDLPLDLLIEMKLSTFLSEKCVDYLDLDGGKGQVEEEWIKVASIGKGQAYELCKSELGKSSGLLPCGGVAWSPTSKIAGDVFCFLPLTVPSSFLPVCINGAFAVSEDRRNLWRSTGGLQSFIANFKSNWNNALCEDVVVSAYITLLCDINVQGYRPSNGSSFFLWPNPDNTSSKGDYGKVVTGLFQAIANGKCGEDPPKVFFKDGLPFSINELQFGDELIQDDQNMFPVFEKVVEQLTNKIVVKLPSWVRRGFSAAECVHVQNRTYSWVTFFCDVVIPGLHQLIDEDVKTLIAFALSCRDTRVLDLLKKHPCIPCASSRGFICKVPSALLDPTLFKEIFSEFEEVYPDTSFLRHLDKYQIETLREIGGMRKELTCGEIIERASSVKSLWSTDKEMAKTRVNGILKYLDGELQTGFEQKYQSLKYDLQTTIFLPSVRGTEDEVLQSPQNIYHPNKKDLVGEVCFILSEMTSIVTLTTVWNFLDVGNKQVKFTDIRENVHKLQGLNMTSDLQVKWTSIYRYLQEQLHVPEVVEFIRREKCFLIDNYFVEAYKLSRNSDPFAPYLFQAPPTLKKFRKLLNAAGVKDKFEVNDIIVALNCLKDDNDEKALDDEMLGSVLTKLIKPLFDKANKIPTEMRADIPLPDSTNVLRASGTLSFCDLEEFEHLARSKKYHLSHSEIPLRHAKALGVRDVREQMLKSYTHSLPGFGESLGENFGQQEELINRIKRIMEGYPCDFAILKELVQNADDSNATVVHFVLDYRQHPHNRLFYEEMKHLQGPALLAYNDRPFSDEDIKGIQKLGEGSKGDAIHKTGRYGVGFNVVYHLTDCPMFLSEKNTLCIFDPTLNFIKDATSNNPGRMFRPVDEDMIDSYADIFNCFLSFSETFSLERGSLFRFPLRKNDSALGRRKTVEDVNLLLDEFRKEMFDSLLFLKSVREISISVRKEFGPVNTPYTVNAHYLHGDVLEREKFFLKMSELGMNLDFDVNDLQYVTTIGDNCGNKEDWLVHQRLGFSNKHVVRESVRHANSSSNLKLIPKGGVAARLNFTQHARKVNGKSFCFLPLPVRTNLPVHVDGYFALGHEARRNLCEAPEGDARSDWNYLLAKDIIASSYVLAVQKLKDDIIRSCRHPFDINIVNAKLSHYHSMFPVFPRNEKGHRRSALEEICHAFYKQIATKESTLFPVCFGDNIRWCSCMPRANEKGYFYSVPYYSEREHDLRLLLLKLGFPILETPLTICKAMKKALTGQEEFTVLEISPYFVVEYLKTEGMKMNLCSTPIRLKNTLIENTYNLRLIFDYILQQQNFTLSGLPLLLTNDGVLQDFRRESPVFHSNFLDLLPNCSGEFLHFCLLQKLSEADDCFKTLQLTDVVERLETYLPKTQFQKSQYIMRNEKLPTNRWLVRLWDFLQKTTQELTSSKLQVRTSSKEYLINTLGNWCIFPAHDQEQNFLVPMALTKTVLSTHQNNFHSDMSRILREMNCPLVDYKVFDKNEELGQFFIQFSSVLDNISDILVVLERLLRVNTHCFDDLRGRDHESILRYFNSGVLSLPKESIDIIRNLPCFENICGNHEKLSKKAYVVSMEDIPETDLNKWVSRCRVLLLKKRKIPDKIIEALCIKDLSDKDLYKKFVLPYFAELSIDARWDHLQKLMQMVRADDDPDSVVLHLNLKSTPLITNEDGNLKLANFFHDDKNPVFKEMLSEEKFPPKHPVLDLQYLWLDFLKKIGLQTEVSESQFESFLKQVSNEENSTRKREEILVKYLLQSHHLHQSSYFQNVAKIPFITAAKVDSDHSELHEQCTKNKVALAAISVAHHDLVWSITPVRPVWVKFPLCESCGDVLKLKISETDEPTITQVLRHTHKLFAAIKVSKNVSHSKPPVTITHASLINRIITKILEFLTKNCQRAKTCGNCSAKNDCCDNCQTICQSLEDVAIIPVGDGVFFKAKRLTRRLPKSENDKLFLFLKEIPDFLVPHNCLLYCLGATQKPSLSQYASALQLIAKEKKNLKQNPPLRLAAEQAMNGFFTCLSDSDSKELETVRVLFLLTTNKGNPIVKSNRLYYNDERTFARRLGKFKHPLMKQLQSVEDKTKCSLTELLRKLGPELRPQLISEHVKETAVASTHHPDFKCSCGLSEQLRSVFSWTSFVRALKYILANQGVEDLSVYDEAFETSFEVCCLPTIQTELVLASEGVVEDSKADNGALFERTEERQVLYLSHNAVPALIHTQIAEGFFRCFQIPFTKTTYLEAILKAETEGEMFENLARLRVKIAESDFEETYLPPELGSDIEEDVICLLEENPMTDFNPEEYVGYNKAEDLPEHFVHAKVIRRVQSGNSDPCQSFLQYGVRYVIDIGEEKEVAAIWLYNFPRPEDPDTIADVNMSDSTAIEVYQHDGTFTRPPNRADEFNNLEQTKRQVTEIIEALWKEESTIRRTGLRRLMRKWHPDKHTPEHRSFAEEVFKHIQREIERLEKGIPSGVDTADDITKWARSNNREQTRYRQNYERRYGRKRSGKKRGKPRGWRQWTSGAQGFFSPPSFRKDIEEARRWQKQAQFDWEAASSLSQGNFFFQWTSSLCFHAVEKSVRAAQIVCGCNINDKHTIMDAAIKLKCHLDIIHLISTLLLVVDKKSHYPSSCPAPKVPHEMYTKAQAEETKRIAREILQQIDAYLQGS